MGIINLKIEVIMPFKSKAQRSYLYIHHPNVAKEFEKQTKKGNKLPEHIKRKKR
jgi:hypothetical protein